MEYEIHNKAWVNFINVGKNNVTCLTKLCCEFDSLQDPNGSTAKTVALHKTTCSIVPLDRLKTTPTSNQYNDEIN